VPFTRRSVTAITAIVGKKRPLALRDSQRDCARNSARIASITCAVRAPDSPVLAHLPLPLSSSTIVWISGWWTLRVADYGNSSTVSPQDADRHWALVESGCVRWPMISLSSSSKSAAWHPGPLPYARRETIDRRDGFRR
jgi:hypothetical protein